MWQRQKLSDHTLMLLQIGSANGIKAGFGSTVQQVYTQHGLFGFYRGFQIAALRAAPMAALSFGTYELVRTMLETQAQAHSQTDSGGVAQVQMQAVPEA